MLILLLLSNHLFVCLLPVIIDLDLQEGEQNGPFKVVRVKQKVPKDGVVHDAYKIAMEADFDGVFN